MIGLLRHKKSGDIYPYTEFWANSDKFEPYEPSLVIEPVEEPNYKEIFSRFTKTTLTKDIAECELERLLTDKEYKDLLKRVFNG